MKVLSVYIEHPNKALDKTFTYLYEGEEAIGPGYRVMINFHNQQIMGYVLSCEDTPYSQEELSKANGYELKEIDRVVDSQPLLNDELLKLAKEVSAHYLAPMISVLQSMLPPSLKPAKSSLNAPKIAYENYVGLLDDNEEDLTPKQIEMLRLVKENDGNILKREVGSPSILQKLLDNERVCIIKKEKMRHEAPKFEQMPAPILTFDQQRAIKDIEESNKDVVLLQGVTGSGKTEVYLSLSENVLSQGKNILMLVPEISLTPIMVEYFSKRFGNDVAILHSQLTPGEKYDEYRRIASGKARVVVGARSAVFAPLDNIGLIVLDEEHVESYKQDNLPYYHAREVAIMRGKHFNAKVILGSATPSLESRARAEKGVYGYVTLPKRINEKQLPLTTIIDLRKPGALASDHSHVFSKELLGKLRETLARNEQAMLLINKRGYSSYVYCADCGHIFSCPNCSSKLTYHANDGMLKCHHCDYVETYPVACPGCGSTKIARVGLGTERLCKILGEYFPNARIGRLDTDIGKARINVPKVLEEFRQGKLDILVGTQMIAKGHDFPNVTLVGLVLADIGLSIPTFRASERTFELIAQAVGRSGRSCKVGEAIIQTYNPSNYAITLGAKQDYETFFKREMHQRHISQYPPYVYLVSIEISGRNEEKVISVAFDLKNLLEKSNFKGLSILGPSTPYFALINGVHYRRLLVKHKDPDKVLPQLDSLVRSLSGVSGIRLQLDVDPNDY